MWGYSGFCEGLGWSDGTVVRDGLTRRARFFALAPEASLMFRLRPAASPYTLRIRFSAPPPAAISGRWRIALNGTSLDFRLLTPRLLEAAVPATLLVDGRNELQFHHAAAPGAATGLSIEKIALVPVTRSSPVSIDAPPRLDPGKRYLCNNAFTARALEAGFSDTEHNGTWTDGPTSTIRFSVPPTSGRMVLKASVIPFLNEKHPEMTLDVAVNGAAAMRRTFSDASKVHDLRIPLPPDALAAGTSITVRLDIRNPASPAAIGEGGQRWLGLFFKELEIVEDRAQDASR
jgi:hypothetical protein